MSDEERGEDPPAEEPPAGDPSASEDAPPGDAPAGDPPAGDASAGDSPAGDPSGSEEPEVGEDPGAYAPRHTQHPKSNARHPKSNARHPEREAGAATTRRVWPRRILVGVNIVVALAIALSAWVVGYALWRFDQIKRIHVSAEIPVAHDPQSRVSMPPPPPGKPAPPPQPAETFLIVGSDTRAGLNQPGDNAFGSSSAVGGARSDTIMLARVVPATKQVALLSIPRDTYFDIPKLGKQKINAALGVSPNLLIRAIETKYGIDINHYIDVDFDSFKDIADALGGVQIYFPTAVRDVNAGLYIGRPGCVNLNGNLALSFVRSREYTYFAQGKGWIQEDQSDLARIERQQMFIRALAAKAQAEGLGNPITLDRIIGGLTKNLTVDDSLSNHDLVSLAATFRNIDPANIVGWTMPAEAETIQTSSGPEDILVPEGAADKAMVAQFLAFGGAPATHAAGPVPTTAPTSAATAVATTSGSGSSSTASSSTSTATASSTSATTTGTSTTTVPPTTSTTYQLPGTPKSGAPVCPN